ncbi:MAG TPA: adenylate/guanylate cyclase domain-containing protein [Acidimicrobiales bacterium]|nr:adenylate/guanylate cyclase domain-containing protein [Acidimicrobiales bacterium]
MPVVFLLTEIVDSIHRWEEDEGAMAAATTRLDAVVAATVGRYRGTQVKPRGEGDSHFLVFDDVVDAIGCAVQLQRSLADEPMLRIRSACHVGEAEFRGGDWYGTTVNRCARLRAAAHGRQALVSPDVAVAAAGRLPDDVMLVSLGRHRLKDLDEPLEVFQVAGPGLVDDHPPLATLALSHGLTLPQSSFVGREADVAAVHAALAAGAAVTVTGAPGAGTTRVATEAAAQWFGVTGERACVVAAHRPSGVDGEHVVRLAPLDDFDAERLLRDRLPDDAAVPPGLATWCDGLPLAVELLARRAASLDAGVLAQRLAADPLAVLAGNRRADPPRHAGMRSTLQAAFDELGASERTELLAAAPGDPRWVECGWHEPDTVLPLVARFLAEQDQTR